jgi:hypothetical protein
MGFSNETRDRAFKRSAARCECHWRGHSHFGRCDSPLTRETAHFVRIETKKHDFSVFNCQVLCHECVTRLVFS